MNKIKFKAGDYVRISRYTLPGDDNCPHKIGELVRIDSIDYTAASDMRYVCSTKENYWWYGDHQLISANVPIAAFPILDI